MTTIVRLITNSTAAFVVLCKERLLLIVPMRRAQGRLLIDQVQGLAQLELPDGWRPARDLNETAGIEAIHAGTDDTSSSSVTPSTTSLLK
jgi:hypothetical protein